MKSMFSQFGKMFQSSISRHLQRLAIVVLFLSYAASADAWSSKVIVAPTTESTGHGKVWVAKASDNYPWNPGNEWEEYEASTSRNSKSGTHTYYLFAGEVEPGYEFIGWTKSQTGTTHIGGSDVGEASSSAPSYWEISSEMDGDSKVNSGDNKYYAIFDCKYSYLHKAKAVAVAYEGMPVGVVSVDFDETPKSLEDVTNWSDPTQQNNECVIDNTGSTEAVSYKLNYYANPIDFSGVEGMENMNFIFDGWYADADCQTKISDKNPYIHEVNFLEYNPDKSAAEAGEYDPSATPLYAKFRFDAYYYYSGAIAGFALNSEKVGKITVSVIDANPDKQITTTEDRPLITTIYPLSTEDAAINDANVYRVEPKSDVNYSFTYTLSEIPDNTKATFMGWSASPYGGTYLQYTPKLTYTRDDYTAYSLDSTDASYTAPIYAVFLSYWYKDPSVRLTTSSLGLGQVAATYSEDIPTDWTTEQVGATVNQERIESEDGHAYTVYYHAKPNHGSYFKGWINVDNPNKLIAGDILNPNGDNVYTYDTTYTTKSTNKNSPFASPALYAVFESDIAILQQDKMICYQDVNGVKNINDAKVIINFNKADKITATLTGEWQNYFLISDKAQTTIGNEVELNTSEGLATLIVSYKKDKPLDDAIGKEARIKLSTYYDGGTVERELLIKVETVPVITFLPTDGKGSYTIKHTDGNGIEYAMPIDRDENVEVAITHESMSTMEMIVTDNDEDDLTFYGWQMTTAGGIEYISYDEKFTYTFNQPSIVRPVFTSSEVALFSIINDASGAQYDDLQKAIDAAVKMGGDQVVVFSNGGKTIGTLQQGNYVIYPNITLLIPGVGPDDGVTMPNEQDEDQYVCRFKHDGQVSGTSIATEIVLTENDYLTNIGNPNPKVYRKLRIQDNTTITVQDGASLYVYAIINRNGQDYEGRPYSYGQMELGENCQINLEDGGTLYAFGYITGAYSSSVIANSGAEVHEIFQYSDPRGGAAVAHLFLYRKDYRVFPFGQYYVQNIEIPLEIKSGATEYVTITADVLNPYVLTSKYVIPHRGEGITAATSGLFRLSNNTSLIKYYDPNTDRQKYVFKGTGINPGQVNLGIVHIQMGDLSGAVGDKMDSDLLGWGAGLLMKDLRNVQLNSKEYVLPITNNLDLIVENANVIIPNNFAFLAGSTMSVDNKSNVELQSGNVYIYDAAQSVLPGVDQTTVGTPGNGSGYFSSVNSVLKSIVATPNNTHKNDSTYKRLAKDLQDAKWLINGKVVVKSGAGLYTTADGAQIVSTQNGQVQFESTLSDTKTYQAKYVSGVYTGLLKSDGIHNRVEFAVNSAKLQHANKKYATTSAGTYTYDPAQGKWITGTSTVALQGDTLCVTIPGNNVSSVIKSSIASAASATITTNNNSTATVTQSYSGNQLQLNVTYTPTNIAGNYEGIITIKNSDGTEIAAQRVALIEDYTPRFTAIETYNSSAYIGYTSEVSPNIVPEANNVAGLISGTYTSQWVAEFSGTHADEFRLVWGEGDNKLSNAKIVFRPKTVGEKSALLSLTCTYKDAANITFTKTVAIPITATAHTLAANPLAYAEGIDSIFVSAEATRLFTDVANGNTNPIDVAVEYNGASTSDYLTIGSSGISTTIQPMKMGTVTVTATQAADLTNGIAAATISKTITITDNIVWNWDILYFGSENIYPITTMYDDWRLDILDNHLNVIREFNSVSTGDYQVILEAWPDGEANPTFTFTYDDGTGEKTETFTSRVVRDPRQLSVYVNEKAVYEAVTWNMNRIETAADSKDFFVNFNSTENQVAQWTCYFLGIPDKLTFNASGSNNWQIEESSNGINWTIAYPWAKIGSTTEFELSLQPSTNYLRISYGTGGVGVLSTITITELVTAKADVEKLYMPIIDPSSQKSVVFTYVSESDLSLTTNNTVFTTDPTALTGTDQSPFYQIKRVAVTSTATDEITDGLLSVSGANATVPIRTFTYPQDLPIQLASDEVERYYFVTSESYNTSWSNDDATRAIIMRNAVADAAPYVVFHFSDEPVPGVISFNYTGVSEGATWSVQESADGTNWFDLSVNESETTGTVMRNFNRPETSRYVRVTYNSDYAGVVELTNMAILPTTSVVVDPASMTVFSDKNEELSITASNLQDVTFTTSPLVDGTPVFTIVDEDGANLDDAELTTLFAGDGTHKESVYIKYTSSAAITYGSLVITTNTDANGTPLTEPEVLATVELTGINRSLPIGKSGIYTGVGDGLTIAGEWDGSTRREVNTQHAFSSDNKPLFDYVIIYGETTTTDGSSTITKPSSTAGSNAQTPCYIYTVSDDGNSYIMQDLTHFVENANSSSKSWKGAISIADKDETKVDDAPEQLRVYITGFCPYASTGYTQSDEGVWYFEGDAGDKLDIYLEDCYIYSRYKSKRGNAFTRESGESYSGIVARGSGAVLLFACKNRKDGLDTPFEVTIHTRGSNLLKSHYGCLFSSFVGRAFQISSPVHIYMQSEAHYDNSYTTLTFDDKWPTTSATDANGVFTTIERTNGFLSLQKQVNNAPSIDMGNKKTVVNFRGGHVELQNACISSDNYESSLAISYRTGVYGPSKFRFVLSYGIGTDGVEGTVNFYDGTTSVLPMTVPERFRQYYLMDTDANGNELTTTSCLRTPKNTYVYGGSHCMMRACSEPTSKGGAPTDGATGKPLGKFEYTQGWTENGSYGLVTPNVFPDDCLKGYYEKAAGYENQTYGLQSVTPVDGKLNFWIPDLDCSEFEVKPEVDQKISFWKASMTYIAASYGVYKGDVGGDFSVEMEDGNQVEQVQNLLYCQIDQNISDVIRENTGENKYVAPVLNPAPDGGYISIAPTSVGEDLQHYIGNEEPYQVEDKVYYVTTIPQADVWINFTAPFNVEKIYVVETYDEDYLSTTFDTRDDVMKEQAKHNADFAAFFGVAIALESKKTFNLIYQDYLGWVREQDGSTDKRGMLELEHYYETKDAEGKFNSNWKTADYYLYKNTGNWTLNAGKLDTKWNFVTTKEGTEKNILLKQGETYSMLFPYCTGCDVTKDDEGNVETDENGDPIIKTRDYWDYWSGKFLIFESTDGPHIIQGSKYVGEADPDGSKSGDWAFEAVTALQDEAKLMGNNTFASMTIDDANVHVYSANPMQETYDSNYGDLLTIAPTSTFLYGDLPERDGIRPRIMRDGSLRYDNQNTTTGGKIPTVGGGNDMFITAIDGGINIAVAAPQVVRVLSSTGSVIFAGTITTATDVLLPTSGIYIISGENEVQKILF